MVVITWKITTSIFASGKTSNYSTKIDIFREMAYKEVISFYSTVTVLLIVEERCGKNSPVISVQCKIVLDSPPRLLSKSAQQQCRWTDTIRCAAIYGWTYRSEFTGCFWFILVSYRSPTTGMPLTEKSSTPLTTTKDHVKVCLRELQTWQKYFRLDTRLIKSGTHTLNHCTNSCFYTKLLFLVSYDYVLHSTTFSRILGKLLILRLTQTKAYRKAPRPRP